MRPRERPKMGRRRLYCTIFQTWPVPAELEFTLTQTAWLSPIASAPGAFRSPAASTVHWPNGPTFVSRPVVPGASPEIGSQRTAGLDRLPRDAVFNQWIN